MTRHNLAFWVLAFLVTIASMVFLSPASAFRGYTASPVVRCFNSQFIASGASATTTTPLDLGMAEKYGMQWQTSASPNVTFSILQSNTTTGNFTLWVSPSSAGTTLTNSVTITTTNGGTDLVLPPSRYAKIQMTNNAGTSATVTLTACLQ